MAGARLLTRASALAFLLAVFDHFFLSFFVSFWNQKWLRAGYVFGWCGSQFLTLLKCNSLILPSLQGMSFLLYFHRKRTWISYANQNWTRRKGNNDSIKNRFAHGSKNKVAPNQFLIHQWTKNRQQKLTKKRQQNITKKRQHAESQTLVRHNCSKECLAQGVRLTLNLNAWRALRLPEPHVYKNAHFHGTIHHLNVFRSDWNYISTEAAIFFQMWSDKKLTPPCRKFKNLVIFFFIKSSTTVTFFRWWFLQILCSEIGNRQKSPLSPLFFDMFFSPEPEPRPQTPPAPRHTAPTTADHRRTAEPLRDFILKKTEKTHWNPLTLAFET